MGTIIDAQQNNEQQDFPTRERALRNIYPDTLSSFEEILERDGFVKFHKKPLGTND